MAGDAAASSGKTKLLFVCLGNICRWVEGDLEWTVCPCVHGPLGLCS